MGLERLALSLVPKDSHQRTESNVTEGYTDTDSNQWRHRDGTGLGNREEMIQECGNGSNCCRFMNKDVQNQAKHGCGVNCLSMDVDCNFSCEENSIENCHLNSPRAYLYEVSCLGQSPSILLATCSVEAHRQMSRVDLCLPYEEGVCCGQQVDVGGFVQCGMGALDNKGGSNVMDSNLECLAIEEGSIGRADVADSERVEFSDGSKLVFLSLSGLALITDDGLRYFTSRNYYNVHECFDFSWISNLFAVKNIICEIQIHENNLNASEYLKLPLG